jgi:DNA-directed RNA polymerase beta' subunit
MSFQTPSKKKINKVRSHEDIISQAPQGKYAQAMISVLNSNTAIYDHKYYPNGLEKNILDSYIKGTDRLCKYCERSTKLCVGHRIGMVLPFYFAYPTDRAVLVGFLNAICLSYVKKGSKFNVIGCCFHSNTGELKGNTIISNLASSKKVCPKCSLSREYGKFVPDKTGGIGFELSAEKKSIPVDYNEIMDYLTVKKEAYMESCKHYGIGSDIRSMITNVLYITPPSLRPALDGKNHIETDLYLEVLKQCSSISYIEPITNISSSTHKTVMEIAYLSMHNPSKNVVSNSLFLPNAPTKHQSADKTNFQDIAGKEGSIRYYVNTGNPTNNARSVVVPSDDVYGTFILSEHMRPLLIAEKISVYNLEFLEICAQNKFIRKIWRAKTRQYEVYHKGDILNVGDTAYRLIMTGDVVSANRQPTLHHLSLMAHNVSFKNTATLALHRCATFAYNADHDGDEMNIHCLPSFSSRLELSSILHSINLLVTHGKPSIGPLFHELGILNILSIRAEMEVDEDEADMYFEALNRLEPVKDTSCEWYERIATYEERREYAYNKFNLGEVPVTTIDTYRDIISLLFPVGYYYNDRGLHIYDGIYISGELNKKNIGISKGSGFHMMYGLYSTKRMARFMNDVCDICDVYMKNNVVSLDPKNMQSSEEYKLGIMEIDRKMEKELAPLLAMYRDANSSIERDYIEQKISEVSAQPTNYALQALDKTNITGGETKEERLKIAEKRYKNVQNILFKSGSRGNPINQVQISMEVGQQYMNGKRIESDSMPYHNNPYDLHPTPEKKGYISSSFSTELTSPEYATHSKPVRASIVSSKLDVAASGEISNLLMMICGPYILQGDMTLTYGPIVVSHTLGGFIDPTHHMPMYKYNRVSFVDFGALAEQVSSRLRIKK